MAEQLRQGKVRDLYKADEGQIVLIASDRVSTYDAVHPTPIPDKGRILTAISAHWFDQIGALADHHLISTRLADLPADMQTDDNRGRSMLVEACEVIPFECVVRGYLTGSGWKSYQQEGHVCGVELPEGLQEADQLPSPIFTPTTKAETGHDEPITFEEMAAQTGAELATKLRDMSLAVYEHGHKIAKESGVLLADTKFEFGHPLGADGSPDTERIILIDEVLTPDSSRYWPADEWAPGSTPASFDKQIVRDHASASGWDKQPPAPELPDEVVNKARDRYLELLDRLTGQSLDQWLASC